MDKRLCNKFKNTKLQNNYINICTLKTVYNKFANNIYIFLDEILHASDEINTVFEKYTSVIVQGNVSGTNKEEQHSLLDLESTPVESAIAQMAVSEITSPKDVDVLCDIFNSTNIPDTVLSTNDILLPELATNKDVKGMYKYVHYVLA